MPSVPAQAVGDLRGIEPVHLGAVDLDDDVARPQAGAVGGRLGERMHDHCLVVARRDHHADAGVLAALILAHAPVRLGVEELGVRIETGEHLRDRALVDRGFRVHFVRVVLLDFVEHLAEYAEALLDLVVGGCGRYADPWAEETA